MKDGTRYAARFKRAYTKLRQSARDLEIPGQDDPVRRLSIAILGIECGDDVAGRAVDRAFTVMVDWNELRVSSVEELHSAVGNTIPQGKLRCEQLVEALQSVYDQENALSLDRLRGIGRREARQQLDLLGGVDEFAAASVVLWSLGGHAVPVDDPVLEWLREADLVNPTASRAEVQAFLERHVNANDAKETCVVLRSIAQEKRAAARGAKKTKPTSASKSKKKT
jgi:endonuclease III